MTLVLLAVTRAEAAAERQHPDPFVRLWDEYPELECFTCGAEFTVAGSGGGTMLLPDRTPDKLIAAPLCRDCWALPELYRMGRCLKMWRRMFARPGHPQMHFGVRRRR